MSLLQMRQAAEQLMAELRYDEALYLLRDVIALGPPDAGTHLAAGICLAELGSRDEAAFELETALTLDCGLFARIEDDPRLP